MDLVFCGTPQFAVPTLEKLVEAGHRVRLVICQPDRPSGRGQPIKAPAVKQRAAELKLPVIQPPSIKNNAELRAKLEDLTPEAIIVVAYGRLIPKWMLDLARHGNLNLHGSLLPKYRGAAPIQWAIANGERVTGVTTMRLDEGLDTGDILLQKEIAIAPEDTAVTLAPRMAAAGAELMVETLQRLQQGSLQPRPQDHAQASLARILKREDGRMDFSLPAAALVNRLRGFQPWPGAYTRFRGKHLQILAARVAEGAPHLTAGELLAKDRRLLVGCGTSSVLEITKLQVEGKTPMQAEQFVNGYRPRPGEQLGQAESGG